jgi:hypothetical protein
MQTTRESFLYLNAYRIILQKYLLIYWFLFRTLVLNGMNGEDNGERSPEGFQPIKLALGTRKADFMTYSNIRSTGIGRLTVEFRNINIEYN